MEIKQSYGQLLFDKYAKSTQWEKNLFQQVVLKQFFFYMQKKFIGHLHYIQKLSLNGLTK